MYAYIRHSGKQFKVSEGSRILVDKVELAEGETFELSEKDLLMTVNEEHQTDFQPKVKVTCKVLRNFKGKKIYVLKQKPKKGYRRKRGYRHLFSELLIEKIAQASAS